jgi:hypothetical protein
VRAEPAAERCAKVQAHGRCEGPEAAAPEDLSDGRRHGEQFVNDGGEARLEIERSELGRLAVEVGGDRLAMMRSISMGRAPRPSGSGGGLGTGCCGSSLALGRRASAHHALSVGSGIPHASAKSACSRSPCSLASPSEHEGA